MVKDANPQMTAEELAELLPIFAEKVYALRTNDTQE
jgi:hypothetical protein